MHRPAIAREHVPRQRRCRPVGGRPVGPRGSPVPRPGPARAETKFPVSEISLAREIPISRGRIWLSPHPGRRPTRAWVSANQAAVAAAISTSQARASSKPPVMAWPLMAPMIGPAEGADRSASCRRRSCPRAPRCRAPSDRDPAQKARPAPVRITAAGGGIGLEIGERAFARGRPAAHRDRAFMACGRFSVTNRDLVLLLDPEHGFRHAASLFLAALSSRYCFPIHRGAVRRRCAAASEKPRIRARLARARPHARSSRRDESGAAAGPQCAGAAPRRWQLRPDLCNGLAVYRAGGSPPMARSRS